MSILTEKARAYGESCWQARQDLWKNRPAYPQAREALSAEEQELFTFLAGTLPATDLGDYEPKLLTSHIQEALTARAAFPWCAALSQEQFLLWVLCPRVNNEALSHCRGLFRQELAPRLAGLTLKEAILAVNRWCGAQVVYRSTDNTTSSALDIYRRGWGRCGEESVFAVNALRSVGIAARQVYAPWWSHCDDNHAWVEAWDGESWRFLGACEPEPQLDRGWFTCAAGRAMLCHVKAFVGPGQGWRSLFPGASPLDLDRRQGVAYQSVTARYGPVRPFAIYVTGQDGGPAAGAAVSLYILNDGALRPIARRLTDESGGARLNLGLGSLWVVAEKNGQRAEALVHTGEVEAASLTLGADQVKPGAFDFFAPADSGVTPPPLSPEEQARRRQELAAAKSARESRPAYTPAPVGGCPGLTEKDRAGEIAPQVLAECPSQNGEGELGPWLASPRIGWEPLAPWRQLLCDMPAEPDRLWAWLKTHLPDAESFPDLPQTPGGAWRLSRGDEPGRAALFCALCRANGVPARLGADGLPEFWQTGAFRRGDGLGLGTVTIPCPVEETARWSLTRLGESWSTVAVCQPNTPLTLPEGVYRLTTAVRLPDGNQLGWFQDFTLSPGESLTVEPVFRAPREDQLLRSLPLPELGFSCPGLSLLCWVQPGEEPTEHLLNELAPVGRRLTELGCQVHMICEEPEKLRALPEVQRRPWNEDAAEAAVRRMYLEPGRLPLVVLAQEGRRARFACAGYQVGLGELVTRLAALLAK